MLNILYTTRFKKDLKLMQKRNKDIRKLKLLMSKVANKDPLDQKYKKHKLTGSYKNRWECHVDPDWLLIYTETSVEVIYERTGSHSDLFN